MHYEHYTQPILSLDKWLGRVAKSIWLAAVMAAGALTLGVLGYHFLGKLPWVDAFLEASMILGGMGPVATMTGNPVKIFASIYALMSGLFLISATGVLLAPWVHRLLHYFYQERRKANRGGPKRRATDRQ